MVFIVVVVVVDAEAVVCGGELCLYFGNIALCRTANIQLDHQR